MTLFRRLALSVCAVIVAAGTASAQTALNSTTLSTAITTTSQDTIVLAATTNVSVGDILFVNREAMKVFSVTPTKVSRGHQSRATTHLAGEVVYTGAPERFKETVPTGGSCTRATERFLPRIVLPAGDVYDCYTSANVWIHLNSPAAIVRECRMLLIADMVDQSCFVADRPYAIVKILEVHKVAEAGGTLTMIPKKQTGTQAPASGTALATAIDGVTTGNAAETVKTATLTTTTSALLLAAGDRVGIDFTDDSAGELAGVTFTFVMVPR